MQATLDALDRAEQGNADVNTLSTEQASRVRERLDQFLRERGLYDEIRREIKQQQTGETAEGIGDEGPGRDPVSAARRVVRSTGLLDRIVQSLEGQQEPGKYPAVEAPRPPASDSAHFAGGEEDTAPAPSENDAEEETSRRRPGPRRAVEASRRMGEGIPSSNEARRTLRVHVKGGRAFLGALEWEADGDEEEEEEARKGEEERTTQDAVVAPGRFFVLHLCFQGQRFRSALVPATVDPAFDEVFHVHIAATASDVLRDRRKRNAFPTAAEMLYVEEPLRLVLTAVHIPPASQGTSAPAHGNLGHAGRHTVPGDVSVELVSSCTLDWRAVLTQAVFRTTVELPAVGGAGADGVSVGILPVQLSLEPALASSGVRPPSELTFRQHEETHTRESASRRFFAYARGWWRDFQEAHPSFRKRLVKIYSETEHGRHRCVCCFVQPTSCGRLLDSPQHAARFVSLIPVRRLEGIGETRREVWLDPHTFLVAKRGDVEDHAILLCNLLLGFGLDAYVAIGTRLDADGVEEEHAWVMTRSRNGESRHRHAARLHDTHVAWGSDEAWAVRFWESTTGEQVVPTERLSSGHRFLRVGCVFRDTAFFANQQRDDTVTNCVWDLDDLALWKQMDPGLLDALPHSPPVPLCPPTVPSGPLAASIEDAIQEEVSALRESRGSSTVWDSQLGYLMSPALAAYESERLTGAAFGASEFQAAVRRAVPEGYVFKGFPVQFTHTSPLRMMAAFQASATARTILMARGVDVRFAVRCRVFPYPEDTVAVWVILAVRYREISDEPEAGDDVPARARAFAERLQSHG